MASREFRVSRFEENLIYGIAAKSIAELKRKAIQFLNFNEIEDIAICRENGTLIEDEDYFNLLQNNERVIALPWADVPRLVNQQNLLSSFRQVVTEILGTDNINIDELRSFLDENVIRTLKKLIRLLETRAHLTTREDDSNWFEGFKSRAKTKEQYLRSLARGRIQSYLRDFNDRWPHYFEELWPQYVTEERVVEVLKQRIENIAARMGETLRQHQYYSCYFDRRDQNCGHRYCDDEGTFSCQGRYNEDLCNSGHTINPYDNMESRILFSLWNLDHVTERHAVIRTFVEAAVQLWSAPGISERRLMQYLFERENLKFVYKPCHVMGRHVDRIIQQDEFLD